MCHRILRIDLSEYRPYIEQLQEKLNEDGANKMSMTDAVKIAVEQALQRLVPDVVIRKTRKRYIHIPF